MKPLRIKRVGLLLVAILVVFIALIPIRQALACRSQLRVLVSNLHMYRLQCGGHYPPDILVTANAFYMDASRKQIPFSGNKLAWMNLSCPGVGREYSTAPTAKQSDYVYVNWEPFFGTNDAPAQYPLFYDRSLSNHLRIGVNVITTTSFFWDFRGHWLRDFAEKHPEYHLPMPE